MFLVSTSYGTSHISSSSSGRKYGFEEPPSDLNPGDIIDIQRKGYRHFAIYIGKGIVIHRVVDGKIGIVKEDKLWNVIEEDKWKRNTYDGQMVPYGSGYQIVVRAMSKLGPSEYHPLTKNCEHLANWCRYNLETSKQVTDYCFWTWFDGSKQRKSYIDIDNYHSHFAFCADDQLELDELLYHFKFYDNKTRDQCIDLLHKIHKVSTRLKNGLGSRLPDVSPDDGDNLRDLAKTLQFNPTTHANVVKRMKKLFETRLLKHEAVELAQEAMDISVKITKTYGADQSMINEAQRLKDHPEDHVEIVKNMRKISDSMGVSAEVYELIANVENVSNSVVSRGQLSRIRYYLLDRIAIIPFMTSFKDEEMDRLKIEASNFLSGADKTFKELRNLAIQLQSVGEEDVDAYKVQLWKFERHSLLVMTSRDCLDCVEDIQKVSKKMLKALQSNFEHERAKNFIIATAIASGDASRTFWNILRSFFQ